MKIKDLIAELQKQDPEKEVYVTFPECSNCASPEPLEDYHLHTTTVRDGWDFNNKVKNVLLFGYEA